MRPLLALGVLLVLIGCSSSDVATIELISNPPAPSPIERTPLQLVLIESGEIGSHSLTLAAKDADDLYQIAGTIEYDPILYQVSSVTQADGLGEPANTYFAWSEREQGRISFGLTKRFVGPGAQGDVALVALDITPLAEFSLGDFSLDTTPGALIVRDSLKHAIAVVSAQGELQ